MDNKMKKKIVKNGMMPNGECECPVAKIHEEIKRSRKEVSAKVEEVLKSLSDADFSSPETHIQ